MIISVFASNDKVFANCECIKGFAFKNAVLGVNYALLPIICDDFGRLQDNCAHFSRIEYLLPHDRCA